MTEVLDKNKYRCGNKGLFLITLNEEGNITMTRYLPYSSISFLELTDKELCIEKNSRTIFSYSINDTAGSEELQKFFMDIVSYMERGELDARKSIRREVTRVGRKTG